MNETKMRDIISAGWLAMLLLMMTMTMVWILEGTQTGKLTQWVKQEPLWIWPAFFGLEAIMVFLVRVLNLRWFRWLVFVVLVYWTLIFVGTTWILELREDLGRAPYYVILKALRNVISIYITWIAWRWARL